MQVKNLKIATVAALAAMSMYAGSAVAAPVGYGAATTGGGSATPVTAKSLAEIQAAINAYTGTGGLVIKYTGTFDYNSITNVCAQHSKAVQEVSIKNKSNITILGANGSAANFGIRLVNANNIIIRNMKIGLLPGGDNNGDAIGIEGSSANVWIDHNELFSSNTTCPGTGDTMFDGLLDIKKGASKITVSYNYFHDHHKVGLDGSSDTDSTNRYITFHHNWYYNVSSRTPLQRFGYTHIYNNYYNKITVSGINVRMGGYSLIESNYFEDTANPVTSRDSKTIGYWDLRNNYQTGTQWSSSGSGVVNATNWTTTKAFPIALGYTYTPDAVAQVKCIVQATAGVNSNLAETSSSCGSSSGSSSSGSSSSGSSSSGSSSGSSSSGSSSGSSSSGSSSSSSGGSSSAGSSTAPTLAGTGDYPNGFSKCAAAGETCVVPSGSGWVALGRKGNWVSKYVGVGKSVACTAEAFGSDPKGNPNKCSYQK